MNNTQEVQTMVTYMELVSYLEKKYNFVANTSERYLLNSCFKVAKRLYGNDASMDHVTALVTNYNKNCTRKPRCFSPGMNCAFLLCLIMLKLICERLYKN